MTDMVNISVANAGITAILGYLVVFVGLILLMLVVMLSLLLPRRAHRSAPSPLQAPRAS